MSPVSDAMHQEIRARLDAIAAEEGVTILLAVESGSRAWGFHSPDSDYDVRFLYTRPPEWHYRLGKKRDVIERPINDELDISGWELSKALSLMLGSNAVVAEWLQSPIRYIDRPEPVAALADLAGRALDRKSVTWHYLSLARRQLERLRDPEGKVRIKRYFYVIRPVLALRWMRLSGRAMPPMAMAELRTGCALDPAASEAIDRLTLRKMAAAERSSEAGSDPHLDRLISEEVASAEAWLAGAPTKERSALWDEASALHRSLSPP